MVTTRVLVFAAVAFFASRVVTAAPTSSFNIPDGTRTPSLTPVLPAATSHVVRQLTTAFWGHVEEPKRGDYVQLTSSKSET
ncbi:unnamed protein product [Mycena citricolor]|uniref:Uncharacterized protein n=1 Tax=Mycena citricolor TaxID=2018698 RepID=A0AAD2Q2X0_9AGAR|nr:unnamed protein product [Mycena citricolor]